MRLILRSLCLSLPLVAAPLVGCSTTDAGGSGGATESGSSGESGTSAPTTGSTSGAGTTSEGSASATGSTSDGTDPTTGVGTSDATTGVNTTGPATTGPMTTGPDTTGPDTTGGTTDGGSSGGSTGDTTGGIDLCPPMPGDNACTMCNKANCCDQLTACAGDAKCACFFGCLGGGMQPQQCAQTCMTGNPGQNPNIAGLFECSNQNCNMACG